MVLVAQTECLMKDKKPRGCKRKINDPIRIERRMKLAHLVGLIELEYELWEQLKKVDTMQNTMNK